MKTIKKFFVIMMSLSVIFAFGCSSAPPKKRHTAVFSKKKADQRRKVERAEQNKIEKEQRAKDARERRVAEKEKMDERSTRLKTAERKRQHHLEMAKLEDQRRSEKRRMDDNRARQSAIKREMSAKEIYKKKLMGKYPYLAQLSPTWDNSAFKYIAIDGEIFTYEVIKEEIQDRNSIFHLNKKGQLFLNLEKKYEIEFGFYDIGTHRHDTFNAFEIEIINQDLEVIELKKILNRIDQYTISR